MKLKFYVYCPDEEEVVKNIIRAASALGAGVYGKYSVIKIEMTCEKKQANKITEAIKKVHPWEEVDIEFVPLVDLIKS